MPEGLTWVQVTEERLTELYSIIERQKGQLMLTLAVLADLGFELADLGDAIGLS